MRKKIINNEFVDNYWIKKYKSGIIHLLINTKNKWVNYHRYNNNEFGIITTDEEFILNIPELKIPSYYLPTEIQEKDQISFYWIPYNLIKD